MLSSISNDSPRRVPREIQVEEAAHSMAKIILREESGLLLAKTMLGCRTHLGVTLRIV